MNTLPRYITPKLLEALKVSPVVFLNGARQVGKTTIAISIPDALKNTPAARYLTFDSATTMAAAAAAPEALLSSYKGTLIIDEVQLVPDIFRALKLAVDELRKADKEHANGKYLLTGSANILALPKLSDALVGRMSILTLHPFASAEASQAKG